MEATGGPKIAEGLDVARHAIELNVRGVTAVIVVVAIACPKSVSIHQDHGVGTIHIQEGNRGYW